MLPCCGWGFSVGLCLCLFHLSLPFVVDSNSSSFHFFFGKKWSICSYSFGMSEGGGEFRIFLCCHLGPNLLGPYIFYLPFQIYFLLFFTCSICREADLPELYQWAHFWFLIGLDWLEGRRLKSGHFIPPTLFLLWLKAGCACPLLGPSLKLQLCMDCHYNYLSLGLRGSRNFLLWLAHGVTTVIPILVFLNIA